MEYCTIAVRIRNYCEIKNDVVVVVVILLKHNGLAGLEISSSQLWQVDSTSGQKQLTVLKIHGPRRK